MGYPGDLKDEKVMRGFMRVVNYSELHGAHFEK